MPAIVIDLRFSADHHTYDNASYDMVVKSESSSGGYLGVEHFNLNIILETAWEQVDELDLFHS
jgi:hypothetical protein